MFTLATIGQGRDKQFKCLIIIIIIIAFQILLRISEVGYAAVVVLHGGGSHEAPRNAQAGRQGRLRKETSNRQERVH